MSEAWSVLRLLRWTADFFRQHGVETHRLDAEVLLAHVLACKRVDLYLTFDQPVDRPTWSALGFIAYTLRQPGDTTRAKPVPAKPGPGKPTPAKPTPAKPVPSKPAPAKPKPTPSP